MSLYRAFELRLTKNILQHCYAALPVLLCIFDKSSHSQLKYAGLICWRFVLTAEYQVWWPQDGKYVLQSQSQPVRGQLIDFFIERKVPKEPLLFKLVKVPIEVTLGPLKLHLRTIRGLGSNTRVQKWASQVIWYYWGLWPSQTVLQCSSWGFRWVGVSNNSTFDQLEIRSMTVSRFTADLLSVPICKTRSNFFRKYLQRSVDHNPRLSYLKTLNL